MEPKKQKNEEAKAKPDELKTEEAKNVSGGGAIAIPNLIDSQVKGRI